MPKPNLSEIQAAKNSITSNFGPSDRQTIAVTDLISEGPIYGLVDSQASVFLNDDRAAPLSQAASFRSSTGERVVLTNGSTTATITGGGSTPFLVPSNGDKFLIVRAGRGTKTVVATNSSGGSNNANVQTTLTTSDGSNFFTDTMISTTTASPEDYVPLRLNRTSSSHGQTDEGAGEGYITVRTSGSVAEFVPGLGGPAGVWLPDGTYEAEVDTVVKIASISGATVTLDAAWSGTSGTYKFDVSGAITLDADTVTQTQITNYEGVTTQFRTGTLAQAPFAGEGGEGSTAITNTPSAGGSIEQSSNFSGSQAAKELVGSAASGFNLTASQLQEVDEARVTFAYGSGFYAVSGKGKNFPTYIRYRLQIAIKKVGATDFSTPILISPTSHKVHSGMNTNAVTFVEVFDLTKYRPFSDFKVIIDRVDSHQNPGFKGVGETFHDWQNVTAASISNTTCIIKEILTHPYSAMAKVSFSTKQFQSMPTRGYHARGLKVQVPSNYVTREEASDGIANYKRNVTTGVIENTYQDWDGAFRLNKVYTNNPAWVFYDVLTNNRYGLGDFLKDQDIDKFTLFRIARYCDELVSDGKGGQEPRFTANLYLTKQADAYKVIKDIATIFRGLIYYIDGQVFSSMDAPSGPVYNFSRGNVIDGQFSYESTGSKTRVNQVIVTWINPDANFKAEPLIVEDRLDIVKQNKVLTQSSVAMGATSEGQALRYGRWKLWTAANQKEVVNFSTALNASFLVPGDVINIQDSARNSVRYSGRVSNTGTRNTTTIPIDSPVTINGASTYELSVLFVTPGAFATSAVTIDGVAYEKGDLITQAFIDSNGDGTYTLQNIDSVEDAANAKATANATESLILKYGDTTRVENKPLSNSAGSTSALTVSSAFSAVPSAEAIWALVETSSGETVVTSAKQYKILAISESGKNTFDISAVEYFNEKFDAVDEDFTTYVADTVYPAVTSTDTVPPVQSVFTTNQMTNIALGEVLTLHWIPPTQVGEITGVYEHLAGFEIVHPFLDRENPIRIMEPEMTSHSFKDLPIGTYKIAVRAINVLDNVSEPEIITITISDKFDEVIPRTQKGIPYTGDVNAGMQMSNSGSFSFKNSTYTFKHPSARGKDTVGTSNALSNSQDCSGMVATSVTTQTTDEGEFLTDHYYLLLDNSETNDKIKLLRYHKPNGIGTPYFYDSIDGSSTTRFGSALTGTFTKAANASKVTGSGTNFTAQIQQGDVLKLGTEEIEVSAVESNTVLYLAKATDTAHSGVQGFIPNIRIDYINDCIIARAYKDSSDNSFNFVPYAKTDGEVKSAPDVIADGSIAETQIADDAITADKISVSSLSDISTNLGTISGAATTQSAGDNTTNIATTAFVTGAISDLVDSAPGTLNTLNELAAALGDDENFSTTVTNSIATKAPLASPTFTGTVSGITKAMVGLGNVDNTSVADIRSGTTASNVGLGNVTNESKTTMFTDPTFTGTVSGVTKAMVGLTNVDDKSSATIRGELTSSNVTTALGFTPGTSNLALGLTSTTALAGNTTIPNPAITSDGSTPSLASGITAGEVRGLINAGTSSLAVGTSASDALAGDSLSVTKLNAVYASFGTMAAEVANIGTLKTDFLDADKVITRDIRVGPTTSVNSGSLVSGRTYTITDSGTGSSTTRFPGATSNDVGVVFTATGTGDGVGGGVARDHTTVALINGTTLTGQGAHLNSDGDFFVGIHDGARIFFDQSAGTMTVKGTLDASDILAGTLNASSINNISLTTGANGSFSVDSGNTPGQQTILLGNGSRGDNFGNVALGFKAGNNSTSSNSSEARENVCIGVQAGRSMTTGFENIFIGAYAGSAVTGGVANKTGQNNIGIGATGLNAFPTLRDLTSGDDNIALGEGAGIAVTSGSNNLFLGDFSGSSMTTGDDNVLIKTAGGTTGSNNIFIRGGGSMTTGSKNIIIGAFNGNENSLDIRTSSNNIVLSDGDSNVRLHVDSSGTTTFNKRMVIESTGDAETSTTPNILSKGSNNNSTTASFHLLATDADGTARGQITSNKFGISVTSSSDYRLKTDIQDMASATERVLALKPRNFKWIAGDVRADGFIAHEVAEVVPEAVLGEKDATDMQAVDQSKLIPILVKTIQELEARIAVLEG